MADNKFLSMEEYQKLAYNTIRKYANNNKVLKRDPEVIGEIIRWAARSDETYKIIPGKYDGTVGSVDGRRCVWAKYGLLKALKKIRRRREKEFLTLDSVKMEVEDKSNKHSSDVDSIFEVLDNKNVISETEKDMFISHVYDNMTYREIAKKYNISYESVRLKIDKTLNKIREKLK